MCKVPNNYITMFQILAHNFHRLIEYVLLIIIREHIIIFSCIIVIPFLYVTYYCVNNIM